ncbi:N-acetylneuraminate synthase [Desulfatibacillum aliphaticivorans]|uniref:N-acetylneuraminate synthase n=1 Tax=Desulfatibacillum aliphaticivorans TaxID=218208 RepID=B8FJQ9_DESAL|nr:pseudaminic acid synthase [Desulfatibacillum aliphaticivorans]ACL02337.1 N-acetylneuraminate synthase [Desulfatibacillum aliphaticivorans]
MAGTEIQIGDRLVGKGRPVYIIAEMSANHGHDFQEAERIVRAAKECGADALKIQTYTPDTLTIQSDKEHFLVKGTPWDGTTLYDLYGQAYTPWDWQPKLKRLCDELGLDFFSTAFDSTAVDFLEDMGVILYKTASFEIVDIGLIQKMAATGKPLIISTGMSSLGEIEAAVNAARAGGTDEIALLKCTSAYPAPPENMNLAAIPAMERVFSLPVGLSDHTLGIAAPVAAVSLGACIIEKHFTLSRAVPGPDSSFSLEPQEFKAMVESVRAVEKMIGQVRFGPTDKEQNSLVFRRSLFVVEDVKAGEVFTEKNIRSIRPGYGLPPKHLPEILGKKAARDISRGEPMQWELATA